MKNRLSFGAKLMISFLLSDLVVVYCHMRNPFMGFLNSRSSYVLFFFSFCSVLAVLIRRFAPAKSKRPPI